MRSRVFRIAGLTACFLALFLTLGAHWYVLQSFAWARMLAAYSRSAPLSEAIQKTFDGAHPCALCLQIRDGRQQQEREEEKLPWAKTGRAADLFFEHRPATAPRAPSAAVAAVPFVPQGRSDFVASPPKPPPRVV